MPLGVVVTVGNQNRLSRVGEGGGAVGWPWACGAVVLRPVLVLVLAFGCSGAVAAQTIINLDATSTTNGGTSYPMASTGNSSTRSHFFYTPAQLNGVVGQITEFGMQFKYAMTRSWPAVKITMGETTFSATTLSATFANNFNAPGVTPVVVFDGPVPLTAPFVYSGVNNLMIEVTTNGTSTGTGTLSHDWLAQTTPYTNSVVSDSSSTTYTGQLSQGKMYGASFAIIPAIPGSNAQVKAVNSTLGQVGVGSNVLRVTVRNTGSVSLSGQPLTLQYSTDGGVTFPANQSQTFTPVALPSFGEINLDMTTADPYLVPAVQPCSVVVRMNPAIGSVNTSLNAMFYPDPDVSVLMTPLANPQVGANTVLVKIKNNGTFRLTGLPLSLRYTVTGPSGYINQTFTPSALSTSGAVEQFAFTTPWTITSVAPATLTIGISPQLNGDPDTSDSSSQTWADAGSPGYALDFVGGGTSYAGPFAPGILNGKLQAMWTPLQLGNRFGEITEFAFMFAVPTTGTWSNVRITFAETTSTSLSSSYGNSSNGAPSNGNLYEDAYSGPVSVRTTAQNQTWRVKLQKPYTYEGVKNLVATVYASGGSGVIGGALSYGTTADAQAAYSTNAGDGTSGNTIYGVFSACFSMASTLPGDVLMVCHGQFLVTQQGSPLTLSSKTVVARVFNLGQVSHNGVPLTLQYSTDGGLTWPVSQSFTPTTLTPQSAEQFNFTTSVPLSAPTTFVLAVRTLTPFGTYKTVSTRQYVHDMDVTSISLSPAAGQLGVNTVTIGIYDTGDYLYQGGSFPPVQVRYTTDCGATSTTVTVSPTTNPFSFPLLLSSVGTVTITAEITPQEPGDPDARDVLSKTFSGIGMGGTVGQYGTAGNTANQIPFGAYFNAKFQTFWTPAQIGAAVGDITGIGFPFSASANTVSYSNVRVELGETSLTSLSPTFAANYNVPTKPPVVVYNGPLSLALTTYTQQWCMIFDAPYTYTAANNLLVTIYAEGATATTSSPGQILYSSPATNQRVYASNLGDVADGTVGTDFYTRVFLQTQLPQSGAALSVRSVGCAAGTFVVGANTVTASVRNTGLLDMTTTPFTLECSPDGGATWPVSQTFTSSLLAPAQTLQPGQFATLTFGTSWVNPLLASRQLHVRVNPALGTIETSRFRDLRVDADVVAAGVTSIQPGPGNNIVQFTVKNNGDIGLSASQFAARYTADGGSTWVSQSFTAGAALGVSGGTQAFAFSTPWNITSANAATLTVMLHAQPTGDQDPLDSFSVTYPEAGVPGFPYTYTAGSSANAIPFGPGYVNAKYQTMYLPAQVSSTAGYILEFGMPFSGGTTGTWQRVRVQMGETTKTTLAASYASNFNVSTCPAVTVYDGPLTVSTFFPGDVWRIPLTQPYYYSAQRNLLVTLFVEGGAGISGGNVLVSTTSATNQRVFNTDSGDLASGTVAIGYATSGSFRIFASLGGAMLQVTAAEVNSGGPVNIGANTVGFTVRDTGTTSFTGIPFTAQYSTDGGITWPVSQSFTPSSLALLASATFSFPQAWTVPALGAYDVRVRLSPELGTVGQWKSVILRPDPDVALATTFPQNPVVGNNTLTAMLVNNGRFSLSGLTLNLRASLDGGLTYSTQAVAVAGVAAPGGTQTVVFTGPLGLAAAGATSLTVEFYPPLAGDPDSPDTYSRSLPAAGLQQADWQFNPIGGGTTSGNSYPFNINFPNVTPACCKIQTNYTPQELGYSYGRITEFGVQFTGVVNGVSWPRVRIEMGETTRTPASASMTFDDNYDVQEAPKQTVFDGPFAPATGIPEQSWRMLMTTPFFYTGRNSLLVTIYVEGAPSGNASTANVRILTSGAATASFRIFAQNSGDMPTAPSGFISTPHAMGASFRFQGLSAGQNADLAAVLLAAGNAQLGANTVAVRVSNRGVPALTGVPLTLQFSTDGGATWPAAQSQTFTPAGLAMLESEIFSFSAPWTVSAAQSRTLAARINPPLAVGMQLVSRTFRPDADIIAISAASGTPQSGQPVPVIITIRNSGTFGLTGVPLPLRYTANRGATFSQQTFVPSGLSATGSTESFTFAAPWTPDPDGDVISVSTVQQIAGDPDTLDALSVRYPGAAASPVELLTALPQIESQTGGANLGWGYPLEASWHDQRMECIYLATELGAAGLVAGSGIVELALRPSQVPARDIQNFRVRMRHTGATAAGSAFTPQGGLATHFGPAPLTNASMAAGQWLPLPLTPAFIWDGVSNLIVDFSSDSSTYAFLGGVYLRNAAPALRSRVGFADSDAAFPFDTIPNQANVTHIPALRLRFGKTLSITGLSLDAKHVRPNGSLDVFRGETLSAAVTVQNTLSETVTLAVANLLAAYNGTQTAVPGITFIQGAPLTLPPQSSQTFSLSVVIAANAAGSSGESVTLSAAGCSAATPTGNQPVLASVSSGTIGFNLLNGPVPPPLTITTGALAPATPGTPYVQPMSATGGSGTYQWTLAAGSQAQLPASLTLGTVGSATQSAIISGVPQTADLGTRNLLFQCFDGTYRVLKSLPLLVQSAPLAFAVLTGGLPIGTEGTAYPPTSFAATGGSGLYTWGVALGSPSQLPAGLTLGANSGVLSGTPQPLTQGTLSVTIRVSDAFSFADQSLAITINPGPLTWIGPATAAGKESVPVSVQLSAAGGFAPRVFSVAGSSQSSVPAGVTLNPATGVLSGSPAAGSAGVYNVTFSVTSGPVTLSHLVAISIAAAEPLMITTSSLAPAFASAPYSATLAATGGSESFSWTFVSSPILPGALALGGSTGTLSGTPSHADSGRYSLTVTVHDTAGRTAARTLTLAVFQRGARRVELTEVDTGVAPFVEITHTGDVPVGISGWSLTVWSGTVSPQPMTWNTFPLGTLLLPGQLVVVSFGGTAGGMFPSYQTGSPLGTGAATGIAVALYDTAGNVVDFVAGGNVSAGQLQTGNAQPAVIPESDWTSNVPAGSDNRSRVMPIDTNAGADWAVGPFSSRGVLNSGLAFAEIGFLTAALPSGFEGIPISATVVAFGGLPPYTWSLAAPSAPWLSIGQGSGALAGTPPALSAGTKPLTVTATDSRNVSAQLVIALAVVSVPTMPEAVFSIGSVTAPTLRGTAIDLPLVLSGSSPLGRAEVTVSTGNGPDLSLAGVSTATSVLASGVAFELWDRGGGVFTLLGVPTGAAVAALPVGTVATIHFVVGPGVGSNAPATVVPVGILGAAGSGPTGAAVAVGSSAGSISLNDFKRQDVNRNSAVNVQDVQLTVNLILHTATPVYAGQGDVNGSGSVTVADVQSIVNCILNASVCTN